MAYTRDSDLFDSSELDTTQLVDSDDNEPSSSYLFDSIEDLRALEDYDEAVQSPKGKVLFMGRHEETLPYKDYNRYPQFKGRILHPEARGDEWSYEKNQAFMLGAIESGKDFFIVTPLPIVLDRAQRGLEGKCVQKLKLGYAVAEMLWLQDNGYTFVPEGARLACAIAPIKKLDKPIIREYGHTSGDDISAEEQVKRIRAITQGVNTLRTNNAKKVAKAENQPTGIISPQPANQDQPAQNSALKKTTMLTPSPINLGSQAQSQPQPKRQMLILSSSKKSPTLQTNAPTQPPLKKSPTLQPASAPTQPPLKISNPDPRLTLTGWNKPTSKWTVKEKPKAEVDAVNAEGQPSVQATQLAPQVQNTAATQTKKPSSFENYGSRVDSTVKFERGSKATLFEPKANGSNGTVKVPATGNPNSGFKVKK